ncbi:DNA-3-methyladenine glycosylase [Candidatus Woesearchaeota archaeon]|nr:DNA-3-methyladenine glycosylase [Candidatus Woesearchaeota archaeon]
MQSISPEFFNRNTLIIAKALLGKIIDINDIQARIVETEAYRNDPASHAYTKTDRSKIMYDTYGHVYIYLIYGMYNCLNFTTETHGQPGAVLIRAVEPLTKIATMQKRRNTLNTYNLCSGPGKLCQALNITKEFNNTKIGDKIKIYDDGFKVKSIGKSKRIGISKATELQWRFYIKDNKFMSK